jgi:hypothetical protein
MLTAPVMEVRVMVPKPVIGAVTEKSPKERALNGPLASTPARE